ncbi:MAG: hypothetical protein P9L92_01120 [Candidatus Electryonea clarkiae]|nr:hypothetical protein [Candidatus Electryonea clarkiae]MDP8289169.1 hypothetical protein [Candidatus Electryonea clarkiae]
MIVNNGTALWSREEMFSKLSEFADIYAERPIKQNRGGMKSVHMFYVWFILQKIKPAAIIESGVWKGQGTWLFENTCPSAELHCIDPNLNNLMFKSNKASYYQKDFTMIDWSNLPKDSTLCFFDDHQNAYERLKHVRWVNFSHVIFEDNYPALHGDCYSLKKIFMHSGHVTYPCPTPFSRFPKWFIRKTLNRMLKMRSTLFIDVQPNDVDEKHLLENIETYYEFPPIYKTQKTKWGANWDDKHYPTPEPLLTSEPNDKLKVYVNDANEYNWLCYVKLR